MLDPFKTEKKQFRPFVFLLYGKGQSWCVMCAKYSVVLLLPRPVWHSLAHLAPMGLLLQERRGAAGPQRTMEEGEREREEGGEGQRSACMRACVNRALCRSGPSAAYVLYTARLAGDGERAC